MVQKGFGGVGVKGEPVEFVPFAKVPLKVPLKVAFRGSSMVGYCPVGPECVAAGFCRSRPDVLLRIYWSRESDRMGDIGSRASDICVVNATMTASAKVSRDVRAGC